MYLFVKGRKPILFFPVLGKICFILHILAKGCLLGNFSFPSGLGVFPLKPSGHPVFTTLYLYQACSEFLGSCIQQRLNKCWLPWVQADLSREMACWAQIDSRVLEGFSCSEMPLLPAATRFKWHIHISIEMWPKAKAQGPWGPYLVPTLFLVSETLLLHAPPCLDNLQSKILFRSQGFSSSSLQRARFSAWHNIPHVLSE